MLRARADEQEDESGIGCRRDCADERVEPLLGREARDGKDRDVVPSDARLGAKLVTPWREPICLAAEVLDVDRVREHRDPIRVDAPAEHRLAREPADDEHLLCASHDPRHDSFLDRPPPAWPRVSLVALHEEHVRDTVTSTPHRGSL